MVWVRFNVWQWNGCTFYPFFRKFELSMVHICFTIAFSVRYSCRLEKRKCCICGDWRRSLGQNYDLQQPLCIPLFYGCFFLGHSSIAFFGLAQEVDASCSSKDQQWPLCWLMEPKRWVSAFWALQQQLEQFTWTIIGHSSKSSNELSSNRFAILQGIREVFAHIHYVEAWWENSPNHKIFSSIHFRTNFFRGKVDLTKFLRPNHDAKILSFPHCTATLWKLL